MPITSRSLIVGSLGGKAGDSLKEVRIPVSTVWGPVRNRKVTLVGSQSLNSSRKITTLASSKYVSYEILGFCSPPVLDVTLLYLCISCGGSKELLPTSTIHSGVFWTHSGLALESTGLRDPKRKQIDHTDPPNHCVQSVRCSEARGTSGETHEPPDQIQNKSTTGLLMIRHPRENDGQHTGSIWCDTL